MRTLTILFLGALCLASCKGNWRDDPVISAWLEELEHENEPVAEVMAPMVNIRNGTVKGKTGLSVGNHLIYQYLGLPYAKAPVGELRFQAPQPYEGWGENTYSATKHPKSCPQYITNLTRADEDCLFLSIHSRRKGGEDGNGPLLPVVFFIHGGGFVLGQNSYYGSRKLLASEVVLVTINYRLGPIGFLYTGDDTVSANNGMKDMVQALRWVNENIAAFGGDPNQVTVMGESAGSASALYMLISPIAQGLFHKVIAMSGSPLQEWAIDRNPVKSARKIGELVQCPSEPNDELVKCLRTKDWMPIIQAGLGLLHEDFTDFKILISGSTPVVEGNVPGAFLPDDPLTLFTEGPLPDVPVLLGSVQHEGLLPLGVAYFMILHQNKEEMLNNRTYMREYFLGDLLTTYGVNEHSDGASVSQTMAAGYFKPGADRSNFTEIQYELLDMISAAFMKAPILRTADILSRRLSSVYLYSFEYNNQMGNSLYTIITSLLTFVGGKPPMKAGICHADDLMYMFNLPFIFSARDIAFSRTYCELFTNFIIHGTPTPEASDKYPIWPKYDIDYMHYMRLSHEFEVKTDFTSSWRQGTPGV